MKIVFTTDQIYLHGGIERVLALKANYFADVLGYEVTILITDQQGKKPFFHLSQSINIIDLAIYYDRAQSYFSIGNLRKVPDHFFKIKKVLNRIDPDMVITCNFAYEFYWIPFINTASKKIKEYHGSQYKRKLPLASLKARAGAFFQNQIEKRYDALVVLNVDEKTFFKSNNTYVIPNPIQLTDHKATVQHRKVIAAGRIAPVKGFERLIEIWAVIADKYPDWKLDIYGDDYLGTQEELQKQIDSLGLNQKIVFKGTVDNMTKVMCDYSVYLMTSHTECFPMVLLEALSVGLPIIAYDVPTGPRNIIIDAEDGFLIKNDEAKVFSEKLKQLLVSEKKRKNLGIHAKKNVNRFKTENVMREWLKLFNKIKSD